MMVDFLSETTEARRKCNNISIMLKEKNSQPRTLYPANMCLRNEGQI